MKKLVILIATISIIIAWKSKTNSSSDDGIKKTTQSPKMKQNENAATKVTLNGIDSATAYTMKTQFENYENNDKKPQPTSVWFSRASIDSIDSLLHAEIAAQKKENPNRKDTTSGIRIYFACDPSTSTYPLNTSVFLVSTFDSLKYPTGKSRHRDYYTHNAPFLSSPFGKPSHDVSEPGARLYNNKIYICPLKSDGCIIPVHFITCKQAHKWVKNYVGGKGPIITRSEWFELRLIDDLDTELHNIKNHPDGLRIYFAFRDHDPSHPGSTDSQHVFVLMTTKKGRNNKHVDYYDCKTKVYNATGDNGELCPKNCN